MRGGRRAEVRPICSILFCILYSILFLFLCERLVSICVITKFTINVLPWIGDVSSPHSTKHSTLCFTLVFCKAVVSLRARLIHAEALLYHGLGAHFDLNLWPPVLKAHILTN